MGECQIDAEFEYIIVKPIIDKYLTYEPPNSSPIQDGVHIEVVSRLPFTTPCMHGSVECDSTVIRNHMIFHLIRGGALSADWLKSLVQSSWAKRIEELTDDISPLDFIINNPEIKNGKLWKPRDCIERDSTLKGIPFQMFIPTCIFLFYFV